MPDKSAITTSHAPSPAHSYSQGVRSGSFIQVSGQGSVDPETNKYVFAGDVAAQTVRALENVEAVLAAANATFDHVMMLRVYLTKRDDFALMNKAYSEFMGARIRNGVFPSRTTVFTGLPHEDMLVEIDAFACV